MAEQVSYAALTWHDPHRALLSAPATQRWAELENQIRTRWIDGDKKGAYRAEGCLDKFDAALIQAFRLTTFERSLHAQGKAMQLPLGAIALRGTEACGDFEALLLQGRAALDVLSRFIANSLNTSSKGFRRLPKILSNYPNNAKAVQLGDTVRAAWSWFGGLLGGETGSLRDMVAHNHALLESIATYFTVYKLETGKILILDTEIEFGSSGSLFPLLATGRESTKWLSYLVLNCLGIEMGLQPLSPGDCEPNWEALSVPLSKFILDQPTSDSVELLSVQRITPDGFEARTTVCDPSILSKAT
jgi:hypothetical protein